MIVVIKQRFILVHDLVSIVLNPHAYVNVDDLYQSGCIR